MNKEKNQKKNKKKALVVAGVSLFTVLAGTLAYFTTSTDVVNAFKTAVYSNKIVENFTSPTNWKPGDTVDKTIKVTNTGDVDMAVRASFTEKWISANNKEVSL